MLRCFVGVTHRAARQRRFARFRPAGGGAAAAAAPPSKQPDRPGSKLLLRLLLKLNSDWLPERSPAGTLPEPLS